MDRVVTQEIREAARNRCEYCRLAQSHSVLKFHIEHIVARQHGGTDDFSNLALACPECNYYKGPNLTGIDPETAAVTTLFHPRRDRWEDHFRQEGVTILGLTNIGRTTARLLEMNTGDRLRWREILSRSAQFD